jgi:hypothetical protein
MASIELVLWEAEVDSAVAWIKPTRCNRLATSKEVNTFNAVRLGITEE